MKPKIITYILPSHFASALINDDNSGLEDDEINELNEWLDNFKPGVCIGTTEEDPYFSRYNDLNDLAGDVYEFNFIDYSKK
jgi:hypothetical protein